MLVERRGDADHDGVHAADEGVVGGGKESAVAELLDFFKENALDVGTAAVERVDLGLIDVEAGDGKACARIEHGEGKTDIAKADDGEAGGAVLKHSAQGVSCDERVHPDRFLLAGVSLRLNR